MSAPKAYQRVLLYDANNNPWVRGPAVKASAMPVVLATDSDPVPVSQASGVEDSFTVMAINITVGNNKSLLSLYNPTGSGKIVRLREFYLRNPQTSAVTGVAGDFRLFRFAMGSAPTGGASVAVVKHDTADTLGTGIVAGTGHTISGEETNALDRIIMSTDDWGPGTLDQEGAQQNIANYLPARSKRDPQLKAFTARGGQGLHMKFATNSTAGTMDIIFVFTQA